MNTAFNDINKFCKQLTVNDLLNPENWTRPKVNTERSQMNNSREICRSTKGPKWSTELFQPLTHQHVQTTPLSKDHSRRYLTHLTLNAPIVTKVVCFYRLLKCLRSLYGKQCGPRSDCSYRSSLFCGHAVCFFT